MKKLIAFSLLVFVFALTADWKDGQINHGKKVRAEVVSTHAESEDIGGGRKRLTISAAPVAYQEGGQWKKIDSTFTDGADSTNEVNTAKMKVRVYPDGSRKIMPTGETDKYLLLGAPYVLDASLNWKPVDFGAPVRTGNKLTWTKAVGQMSVTHIGHGLKHDIELYGGYVPRNSQFAYPLTLNNLTRVGTSLVDSGTTVAVLRKPVVYDAANQEDVRQITYSFASLNGVTPAVISTLPDLTGMVRPVVDPTVTIQPDATAGIDTTLSSYDPTYNYGAHTSLYVGENNAAAGAIYCTLVKFDLFSVPATFSSATFSIYATADLSSNARTFSVYPLTQAWTEGTGTGAATADGATWNTYNGVNNWPGGAGGGVDIGAAIGSRAFTATETLNEFKSFPLTVKTKAELGTLGWMVKAATETDDAYTFSSSDNATALNRPKLVIEYVGGAVGMLLGN